MSPPGPHRRIIDANANRAREALRVIEDVARFALDDAEAQRSLKSLRHAFQEAIERLLPDDAARLAWRDAPGDVGTRASTPSEADRQTLRDVAGAAFGRAGEALRAAEEGAKLEARADLAGVIESIRYRLYDLEGHLVPRLGASPTQWTLCVLLTESLCEHHAWETVAREAIAGGADCLQLREKSMDGAELLRRAVRLVEIARASDGARPAVIVNDRPDIALLAGADGVHLGQTDLSVGDVRRLAGAQLLVGVSTTNLEEAHRAVRDGADYCGLGPMFHTTTKDKPVLAGPAYLRAYLDDPVVRATPHLAIGGITPELAPALREAGCRGVAVSGAVLKHKRPAANSRAFCEVFAPTHGGDRRRGG